jgi:hypothetical protein
MKTKTPSAIVGLFLIGILNTTFRLVFSRGINNCRSIEHCSPDLTSLDSHYINKTIEIKCFFRGEMPLDDINWTVKLGKHEIMALDMDSEVLYPFGHDYIPDYTSSSNPRPHTVSILKVPLLNASFFTNYTIGLVNEGCFHTVSIGLRERALKYSNQNEAAASSRLQAATGTLFLQLISVLSLLSLQKRIL